MDVDQMFRDSQREKWKGKVLEIEEKRNELLREHQRMQKKVSKGAKYPGQEEKFAQGSCCVRG